MNPNNNQGQPVNPASAPMPIVSPTSPAPEQVGNPVPRTEKKFLLYGVLLGLFVVAVVGVAAFYMMFSPKSNKNVAVTPTETSEVVLTEPTPVEIAEVESAFALDNLIVGLAQADSSLEQELSALEKDSEF